MTALNISCDSCGSKLKVRDESLIGQIQICPKCGNMVLIQPTDATSSGSTTPSTSSEAAASAAKPATPKSAASPILSDFADAADVLDGLASQNSDSNPPAADASAAKVDQAKHEAAATPKPAAPRPKAAQAPAVAKSDQAEAAPAEVAKAEASPTTTPQEQLKPQPKQSPPQQQTESPADESAKPSQQSAQQRLRRPDDTVEDSHVYDDDAPSSFATISRPGPGEGLPLSDSEPSAPPLLPPSQWESESVQTARQYLLYGIAAVVGVMLAIGVTVFAISRIGPDQVADAAPPTESDLPDNSADGSGTGNDNGNSNGTDGSDTDTNPPPNNAVTNTSNNSGTNNLPGTGDVDNANPDVENPSVDNPGVDPVDAVDSGSGDPVEEGPDKEPPGDEIGLTDPPMENEDETDPKDPVGIADDLLKDFWDFQQFPTDGSAEPDQLAKSDDPLEPLELELPSGLNPLPRPDAWKVLIDRRLEDKLAAVHFDKTPLHKFVDFLTDFSTIPISFDTASLERAGVSVKHEISMTIQKETSVKDLLATVLNPLGLKADVAGDQVIIRAETEPATTKIRHEVKDLAPDQPATDALLQTLQTCLAPEQWGEPAASLELDDKGVLAVEGSPEFCDLTLRTCERLRLMRGLDVTSSLGQKLTLQPLRNSTQVLTKTLDLNLVKPTAIRKVLDSIEKQTDLAILINWPALADLGWNPGGENRLFAKEVKVGKALDDLLLPMELRYRFVEPDVLEVTTSKQLSSHRNVEFHDIADISPKTPADKLKDQLTKAFAKPGQESPVAVLVDAPKQTLIVAGPSNLLPLVDKLLDQMRNQSRQAG